MSALGAELTAALRAALGAGVRNASRLSGGDINDAFELELDDDRRLFMKTHRNAPRGMFQAEARGLAWLAEGRALHVPEVVAVGDDRVSFLVLELVEPGPRRRAFDEELGRALAALHGASPSAFGLDHDNFIGSLSQSNRTHARWADFFQSERLEPQLALAAEQGRATSAMRRGFERLFARLASLVGPEEPPARLHGDLWGGNLHVTRDGAACLIDPAAYGGHREVDLAMMRLFGGFGERVFSAYSEAFPLAPGHAERVALYQLYPLLVHVNLFGGGYAASVERVLERYV
ncbi:MAG TPA: fructosamine kinase family protein [Polyangiaceae bacterium]|nr:fructosamine kinase family protein [Polyangiaceae bacterium]